jgi:hypothetical protein
MNDVVVVEPNLPSDTFALGGSPTRRSTSWR